MRGNRVHRSRPHQHRTAHFNSSSAQSSDSSTAPTPPGWVARNDRHRQLINANVFEKDNQNRAKAIEATRRKQAQGHRSGERSRFREFLAHQQAASARTAASSDTNASTPSNELTVEGVRFRVLDGGKKLARVPGELEGVAGPLYQRAWAYLADDTNPTPTPKSTIIAGVKFYRTKSGNLVVNRVVKDQRCVSFTRGNSDLTFRSRSAATKKIDEPCKIFSTSGTVFAPCKAFHSSATRPVAIIARTNQLTRFMP